MSEKIGKAQAEVEPVVIAKMVRDFYSEFSGVYRDEVFISDLCAIGPLQSMIGLAIKNGLLALPLPPQENE
jgi:hypothetical protein